MSIVCHDEGMNDFEQGANGSGNNASLNRWDNLSLPELAIPDRCRLCPHIVEVAKQLDEYEALVKSRISVVTTAGSEALVNRVVQRHMQTLPDGGDPDVIRKQVRNLNDTQREDLCRLADILVNECARRATDAQGQIDSITAGCPGPLEMRANKNNTQVTATVCMSPGNDYGRPI